MIKKLMTIAFSIVAVLALSGCGGSDDYYYDDDLTTLFLIDQDGRSYGGIPYICESMRNWDNTRPNGEFSFYPGEECEFNFDGLNGTDYGDRSDYIYIVDYTDNGKNRIPYECELFNAGNINSTYGDEYSDGTFDYDYDDACVFYF